MKALQRLRDFPFFLLLIFLFFSVVKTRVWFLGRGLDASHQMVLSWAQGQGLAFGREIIFTYGPYMPLYNGVYTPESGWLTLFCFLFIFVCFAILFTLFYTEGKKIYTLFTMVFCCLCINFQADILFYSYIYLYSMTFIYTTRRDKPIFHFCAAVLLTSGLALIMLVKAGFTSTGIIIYWVSAAYCLYKRKYKLALCTGITLLCAQVLFWLLAGQPLSGIIDWYLSLIPITSGYAGAMARSGAPTDLVVFSVVWCLGIAILLSAQLRKPDKIFLACCALCVGFMVFKATFIRHHADFGLLLLFFLLIFTGLPLPKKQQLAFCIAGLFYGLALSFAFPGSVVLRNFYYSIPRDINGLAERISGEAPTIYATQAERRKRIVNLPVLPGTSDIYNWDQGDLLVSGNRYAPRPVPQSYSAYTPGLLRLNAAHLEGKGEMDGKRPPDNIFFRVQAIDNRYPALEDGLSWLTLLNRYHPSRFSLGTLLLQRNASPAPTGSLRLIAKKTLRMEERVSLPDGPAPLFVKIFFKKGLVCSLHGLIYKYPLLDISVQLANGNELTRRIIAGMTETGFFLSPYMGNTREFLLLATNNLEGLAGNRVTDFSISQHRTRLGIGHWDDEYEMELYAYESSLAPTNPSDLPPIVPLVHPGIFKQVQCVGNLDKLTISGSRLAAEGWLVMQDASRATPQIYLLEQTPKGTALIRTTARERPDVAALFHAPGLLESGFSASSEISAPVEEYGVGYQIGDQIFQCTNLRKIPPSALE